MSVQIFLQARIDAVEDFLARTPGVDDPGAADLAFLGRCVYLSLATEFLPRAILRSLGLADVLLGSSGGEQFLLVLPAEFRGTVEALVQQTAEQLYALSGNTLLLRWVTTENLGDWTDVRKRLQDGLDRSRFARAYDDSYFAPFTPAVSAADDQYFAQLGAGVLAGSEIGWSPEDPARFVWDGGTIKMAIGNEPGQVPIARHVAPGADQQVAATMSELGSRAQKSPRWGVLRGDVDLFRIRLRRAQSIEEHLQLSYLYKSFFAGELGLLSSMPAFWQRVTLLYTGGDDFAIAGSWDALIEFAREVHRVFRTLVEASMTEFPGPEGKTITMALSLAQDGDDSLASVYREAGESLAQAKAEGKDSFYLLGRSLEWRQLQEAADLKDEMVRLFEKYGVSRQFLQELGSFYRESTPTVLSKRGRMERLDRPWRYHRRLSVLMGDRKDREFVKLRTSLVTDLIGKNAAQARLRPSGRVALEWTVLALGGSLAPTEG